MAREVKYTIGADSSKYERAMGRVKKSTISAEGSINRAFKAVGLIGAAGVGAFVMMARESLKMGDEIHKLNLRLGISTEALSELRHVANLSGVNFNTMAKSYQKMSENVSDANQGIGTAKDSIKDLGLNIGSLIRMAPERQFEAIADAMLGITNQSDKVRIAADIFGGRGVEMLQVMSKGAAGIREMRKDAGELGLTLSQEGANSIAAFNDEMVRLKGSIMGVVQATVVALGPELTIMVDFFGNKIPKAIEIAIKPLKVWAEIWQTLGWIASGQKGMMPELPAPVVAPEAQKKSPLGISGEVMNGELALLVEKEEQKFQIAMESQTRMEEMLGSSYVFMNEMDNTRAQQEIALATGLEAEIVSLKQRSAGMQKALHASLFSTLLQVAGVSGKKLFYLTKAWEVGSAVMSAFTASNLAMATIPPPMGEVVAAERLKLGLLNAKLIAATAIGQAVASGSGSVGGGTYVSPTVTTPAEIIPTTDVAERSGSITFNIQGPFVGTEEFADWIVDKINAAGDREVFINQSNYATEILD